MTPLNRLSLTSSGGLRSGATISRTQPLLCRLTNRYCAYTTYFVGLFTSDCCSNLSIIEPRGTHAEPGDSPVKSALGLAFHPLLLVQLPSSLAKQLCLMLYHCCGNTVTCFSYKGTTVNHYLTVLLRTSTANPQAL